MYTSTEIKCGETVRVIPAWIPQYTAKAVSVPVVYVHPEGRYFAVEYSFATANCEGTCQTSKFRECFPMVNQEKLCSRIGQGNELPARKDYDESEEEKWLK